MHQIHKTLALFLSHPSTKHLTESAMGSHALDIAADTVVFQFPLLASLIPPEVLSIQGIQKLGQNTFAAMFVVALLQAMVALIQYRTNPSGQLVVPPGLTVGIAKPSSKDSSLLLLTSTTELLNSTETSLSSSGIQSDEETLEISKATPNRYAEILQKINGWLFLLIPWATERLAFFWGRNTHVMHLGIILALNRLFDFPNRFWAAKEEASCVIVPKADPKKLGKPPRNIVVIGDSLAVGLGSVEEFTVSSSSKTETREDASTQSYTKYENTDVDSGTGPVFPRVLAESLSRSFHQSIRWRSAGVDGGDLKWIDELCFDVIEEEVKKKRIPDVVVILCGPNDLKYFVSNPFQAAGPKVFRARLRYLIKRIKEVAPNTSIVVPSFPTQMFHKKSPLNIFPLNFFLDSVIGFWDSQKKMVTDSLPAEIMYFEMNPAEIFEWHKFQRNTDSTLLAPDGVHPNAKCYNLWASSLGTRVAKSLKEFSSTVQ